MTTQDIIAKLKKYHGAHIHRGEWVVVEELRLGSGYLNGHDRRIDLWCLNAFPGKGNRATAYEVKVSRADFMKDVKDPIKQRGALAFSNEFYYAAWKGIIKPTDLPVWSGLVEFDPDRMDDPYYCGEWTITAPYRDKLRPSWPFVVSLMRRAGSMPEPTDPE